MAVIDATRSIAADALTFTPLGESWYAVSPDTLNLAQAVIQRYTFPFIWDPVIIPRHPGGTSAFKIASDHTVRENATHRQLWAANDAAEKDPPATP